MYVTSHDAFNFKVLHYSFVLHPTFNIAFNAIG